MVVLFITFVVRFKLSEKLELFHWFLFLLKRTIISYCLLQLEIPFDFIRCFWIICITWHRFSFVLLGTSYSQLTLAIAVRLDEHFGSMVWLQLTKIWFPLSRFPILRRDHTWLHDTLIMLNWSVIRENCINGSVASPWISKHKRSIHIIWVWAHFFGFICNSYLAVLEPEILSNMLGSN